MTKKTLVSSGRGLAAGLLLAAGLTPGRAAQADGVVPGRFIVHVAAQNDSDANQQADGLNHDYGGHTAGRVPGSHTFALDFSGANNPGAIANALSADSRVLWVEADTYVSAPEVLPAPALPLVTADPFHFPFDITSSSKSYRFQLAYLQINVNYAPISGGGQGVTIAVLDTGAASGHPALQNHLVAGFSLLSNTAAAEDIADGATNASAGHGTMIAGLMAALAPGAKILPIRVLNGDGVGTAFTVAQGIDYAVKHGANIINLSLTSTTSSQIMAQAVADAQQAGVLIVAAAGNSDSAQAVYPAAYPGVLAVSSVDASGVKSAFSNFGAFVSVSAPGDAIASAYFDGRYASGSGTSFAAPFAAAEAALLLSARPNFTAQQARRFILSTARPVDFLNPLYIGQLGAGLIDIDSALFAARSASNACPPYGNGWDGSDPGGNTPSSNGRGPRSKNDADDHSSAPPHHF